MAPVVLYRGPLTDLMIATAAVVGKPVGDGVIPAGAAWQGGPEESTFVPWAVVSTLTASRSGGSIYDPQADWLVPYMVQSFGATRDQCEWLADRVRGEWAALELTTQTLGAHTYQVQQVRVDSIGGINRTDVVDPPVWGQQDQVTVWLTKES